MNTRSMGAAIGAALLSLTATPTLAAYTATLITNSGTAWNTLTDAQLGVAGYTIEGFEQTALATGLRVGTSSAGGSLPLSNTLANLFSSPANDPGGAFAGGAWDGTRTLINTFNNIVGPYSNQGPNPVWGGVTFEFAGGARSVGFSLQQPELEIDVSINGISRGTLSSLVGTSATSSGRVGYFRFDTSGGDVINTLTLNNRSSPGGTDRDGWAIDHLAFSLVAQTTVVPVPAALPLFLSGLGLLAWRMRRSA